MPNRLSVVMIAKNASDVLPECLASVAWADEVVLLDSGSTDSTVEIALQAGAKVFINEDWQGLANSVSSHRATPATILF